MLISSIARRPVLGRRPADRAGHVHLPEGRRRPTSRPNGKAGPSDQLQHRRQPEDLIDDLRRLRLPGVRLPRDQPGAAGGRSLRLFGLNPAPAAGARVLELGCGDGGNLLSLAQALPGASFVGIDAAAGAIARGSELARAAGLRERASCACADLEELPEAEPRASFDYVLAHGVYSWIPPRARVGLLAGVRRHMAPRKGSPTSATTPTPAATCATWRATSSATTCAISPTPRRKLAAAHELMQTIVGDRGALALRAGAARAHGADAALQRRAAVPRRPRRDLNAVLLPRVHRSTPTTTSWRSSPRRTCSRARCATCPRAPGA